MADLLPFVPESRGYRVLQRSGVQSIKLGQGPPRVRQDFIGGTSIVNCTWVLDRPRYDAFMLFYNVTILEGSLPFLANLIIDYSVTTTYRVTMDPQSLKTDSVRGHQYIVSATLEAEAPDVIVTGVQFQAPASIFAPVTPTPEFNEIFSGVDFVQVVGGVLDNGVNPPIAMDGVYDISSVPAAFNMVLDAPETVNPDWLLLPSYPGGNSDTIENVRLVKVPT